MLFYLKIAICVIISISSGTAISQQAAQNPPTMSDAIFFRNGQKYLSTTYQSLENNLFDIYKSTEGNQAQFYFIPPVIIDYSALQSQAVHLCQGQNNRNIQFNFPIMFYNEFFMQEMRQKLYQKDNNLNISNISLGIPASAGVAVFAFDQKGNSYKIFSSIPETQLISGFPIASVANNITATQQAHFDGTCEQLQGVISARRIQGFLIAPGVTAKRNNLNAVGRIISSTTFKTDLNNAESSIDKKIIRSSGGSSGFSINFGSFGGGASNSSGATTTENIKYRIINRSWLENYIDNQMKSITINQYCDDDCASSTIFERLFSIFMDGYKEEVVSIENRNNAYFVRSTSKGELPVGKISVSDDIKNILNQAQTLNEEGEFEYGGIKVKKKNGYITTANNDVSWKRTGDEWVPTNMKAYIFDVSDITKKIDFAYDKIVFGKSSLIATPLAIIDVSVSRMLENIRRKQIDSIRDSLVAFYRDNPTPIAIQPYKVYNRTERALGISYRNTSGRPLNLGISYWPRQLECHITIEINGINVSNVNEFVRPGSNAFCNSVALVPNGFEYKVIVHQFNQNEMLNWSEAMQ